jgi:hypothetical protein
MPVSNDRIYLVKAYRRRLESYRTNREYTDQHKDVEEMSRKRKPDVAFLKAARERLGIDGNVLLEYA